MADYFGNRYFAPRFWETRYFQGGAVDPNAMRASLLGSSSLTAVISFIDGSGGGEKFTVSGGGVVDQFVAQTSVSSRYGTQQRTD